MKNKTDKKIKHSSFYGKFIFLQVFLLILLILLMFSIKFNANYINSIDNFVFYLCGFIRNNIVNNIFLFITYFGESYIIILFLIIFFIFNLKKIVKPLTLVTLTSVGFNYIIKNIIERARPIGQFASNLIINYKFPTSFSFPSGHSQTGLVFYFCLAYLLTKHYYNGKHKKLILTFSLLLPVLIMLSRLVLGVHFFTDVLGGIIIATIIITNYLFFSKRLI